MQRPPPPMRSPNGDQFGVQVEGPITLENIDAAPYVVAHFLFTAANGSDASLFDVDSDLLLDRIPSQVTLVSIRSDWRSRTFANDPQLIEVINRSSRSVTIGRTTGSWFTGFRSIFRLGMPWDGDVKITIDPAEPMAFNLMVRIPEWCHGASIKVNGESLSNADIVRGYARIQRTWKAGDVVALHFPMPVEPVKANPLVEADAGKVALMRGPLVYCVESADNGENVPHLAVAAHSAFRATHEPDLLNGVTLITGPGRLTDAPVWKDSLYAAARKLPEGRTIGMKAVPYYANANRGPVDMAVWLTEVS